MGNLVDQQPLAQRGRELIGNLIEAGILPLKAHRHHRGARALDHLGGKRVPLALNCRAPPIFRGRNRARREHDDHAPIGQMRHGGLAHLKAFLERVLFMGKRHGDHVFSDLLYPGKERTRQDPIVIAHLAHELGQHHAIHQTMGMIGHDDHRARGGNARDLLPRCRQIDPHQAARLFPEFLASGGANALELADAAQKGDLARAPLHGSDDRGLPRVGEGAGVAQLALIIGPAVGLKARGGAGARENRWRPLALLDQIGLLTAARATSPSHATPLHRIYRPPALRVHLPERCLPRLTFRSQ